MAAIRATQATAKDMVEDAMRLIGKLGAGQTSSSIDQTEGLRRLNDLLESWNLDAAMTYEQRRDEKTLTANKNPHTVGKAVNSGSVGDLNIVRPLSIEAASITVNNFEFPVGVLSKEQYQGIPDKTTATARPAALWYERSFPLAKLHPVAGPEFGIDARFVLQATA